MTRLSVDGVRLSDLSILGWSALLSAACLTLLTVQLGMEHAVTGDRPAFVVTAIGAVGLALFAYNEAAPEHEAACEHCGATARTQANRDGVDEVIEVHSSGSPRRATVGPFSMVVQTNSRTRIYCSGECADADRERRSYIEQPDGRALLAERETSISRPAHSVTATDGGTPVGEIVDGIKEHGSGAIRDQALIDALRGASNSSREYDQSDDQGAPQPANGDSDQ